MAHAEAKQAGQTERAGQSERAGQPEEADPEDQDAYDELCAYTLTHSDPAFIHHCVVDAYAAQHASSQSKAITTVFALIGLYLQIERAYSGRQVQLAHMRLARKRKQWPTFTPPPARGAMTVQDVLQAPPGKARDAAIRAWCTAVWECWGSSHAHV
jgi:hypothetical protein